jgi:cell division protein FtsW (lipid II flippase)
MAVVATMPTNNYHIQRIQSVFSGSKDASYQVRARNRSMIFPWILAHPIGGGLGSTGTWGQRFSPGTFLANFPPDSGLVRVAVELGWIGLGFFLFVYYKVLVDGTRLFWTMKNPVYKAMAGGMIAGITPLLIAEWGQEVVGVFPLSLLFWMFLAVLFRAVHFDRQEQLVATQQTPAR